jgi:anti-anti-sigma regulatory factor
MAARTKKKGSLSQTGQENQNTMMEGLAIAAETAQEAFVLDEGDFLPGDAELSPESVNHPEHLEAEYSEEKMNTDTDLPEALSSDETVAEDAVEPVINLDPTLSIQNVVKLYDALKRSYATYDAIEIDASHVSSIDTATLQLFVALKKDALKQKKEVSFFQPSARFIESARLLDLIEILDITAV